MNIEEIKKKQAAGEKLTAGEMFFLKKNDVEKEDHESMESEQITEKIPEEEEGDKEDHENVKNEKASKKEEKKQKKKEKKRTEPKQRIKYPAFYKNFASEYRVIWGILFGLMAIALLIGFILPNDIKIMLLTEIFVKFSQILEGVQTSFQLAIAIFLNNLEVSAILFVLGITVVVPILVVIGNGLMIGIFFDFIIRLEALEPGILISSIIGVIPHGIIEIPIFVITASLGVGMFIKLIAPRKFIPKKSRSRVLLDIVLRYLVIILPLFLLAAFIEAYISPIVSNKINDAVSGRFQNEQLAEFAPDPVMLAKKGCTDVLGGNIIPDNLFSTSSEEQIKIIFDEKIFKQLDSYRNVSKYSINYICGNDGLQISLWEFNDSVMIDYITMQKGIFRDLGYDIEEVKDDLFKIIYDDSFYYYGYIKVEDGIYMTVTYFGQDEALIKSLLKREST